jgi:hypothetical protein
MPASIPSKTAPPRKALKDGREPQECQDENRGREGTRG